ncbi:hypothetical protein Hdeb2414_s0012g00397411 [Helianthus debilis subsp. tardiflorus]
MFVGLDCSSKITRRRSHSSSTLILRLDSSSTADTSSNMQYISSRTKQIRWANRIDLREHTVKHTLRVYRDHL